jgi:putative phosphoribosyl transferase
MFVDAGAHRLDVVADHEQQRRQPVGVLRAALTSISFPMFGVQSPCRRGGGGPTLSSTKARSRERELVVVPFVDRVDAGRRLAERLRHLRGEDVVVLGLPRGGVSVAAEVARALDASLDVIVVRKLGVPSRPELAMGAVGEDGVLVVNERVVRGVHASEVEFAEVERREGEEVQRSARRFRGERAGLLLAGRTVLVVDDGVATGSTARAACRVARAQGAARVVLAVPVCRRDVAGALGDVVDEVVCLVAPEGFSAVGQFYADFRPTSDREVVELLRRGARRAMSVPADPPPPGGPINEVDGIDGVDGVVDEEVEVVAGRAHLGGYLSVPAGARGLVVFVHGSGSSRHSPRNRYVAGVLQAAGLATLLFDLLTPREERDRATVFDIALLAGRLIGTRSPRRRSLFRGPWRPRRLGTSR